MAVLDPATHKNWPEVALFWLMVFVVVVLAATLVLLRIIGKVAKL